MAADPHERYEDELAAYMLGSLEEDESVAFQLHLGSCPRCQARERWLRASVEVLPSSVEQIEPPPGLRTRLMGIVEGEAGVPHEASAAARPAREARGPRSWLDALSLRAAVALAGTVLLVAVGIAGYVIGNESGGSARISVTGTTAAPQTSGTLVRNGDAGILEVTNLPQRKGRLYEVWLLKNGKPVPSALFQVRADGTGSAGIPGGLNGSTQVMVTSEPPGGSEQPTTEPVLVGRT